MRDLTRFQGLGKVPWEDRLALIHEEFPSTVRLEWEQAFQDIELFGRIIRDLLKTDLSEPGRSGPRPSLDRKAAEVRLRQMRGQDFTELPFPQALRVLANGRSHRHLASKVGLDRNMVQKLLAGKREPDIPIMEQVAKSFGKDPSYFLEYRVAYVLGALGAQMAKAPEMTVDLFYRLSRDGRSRRSH